MNQTPSENQTPIYYIYALCDPRQPEVFKYIGKTLDKERRHMDHCYKQRGRSARCPKSQWVAGLFKEGLLPQMIVLATARDPEASRLEVEFIAKHHAGHSLKNVQFAPAISARQFDLKVFERKHIEMALKECRGNKKQAALALGIGRQTLYNKLASFPKED